MTVRDVYLVRTPENVTFEFDLAGVVSRGMAWVLDLITMGVTATIVDLLVGMAMPLFGGLALALRILAGFVVFWGYPTVCEWALAGQTLGKRVLGLRVLQESGTRITFLQSLVRNLVRIVDALPGLFLLGGAIALVDRHGRRLGDSAAGTVVVRERRTPRPSAVVPVVERYNSFIEDPTVVHAARRITPPERDAMVGLGLRRDRLPLPVRHALFRRLGAHLEQRLGIPRPSFFSEEKYVLNLTAAVLARPTLTGRGRTALASSR